MKELHELREKLCEELRKTARKRELSAGDLETAHKLTATVKNIDKIIGSSEGGYSREYSRDYDDGASYRRDSMGRYSRDGADGYSRHGHGDISEQARELMRMASTDREREAISHLLDELR